MTLTIPTTLTADVNEGCKLLCVENGWVTWYQHDKKNDVVTIYTCEINKFEGQTDTQEMELTVSEVKALTKLFK